MSEMNKLSQKSLCCLNGLKNQSTNVIEPFGSCALNSERNSVVSTVGIGLMVIVFPKFPFVPNLLQLLTYRFTSSTVANCKKQLPFVVKRCVIVTI